jgi:hypothetical protein
MMMYEFREVLGDRAYWLDPAKKVFSTRYGY